MILIFVTYNVIDNNNMNGMNELKRLTDESAGSITTIPLISIGFN